MPTTRTSFKNPPIDEVVCGVRFTPLPGIRLPHYGVLWEILKADYPTVKHAAPLIGSRGLAIDEETGAPLPRVWYVSKSEDFLIQLQPDFFALNWRRRAGSYPRFDVVFPKFNDALSTLRTFVTQNGLGELEPYGYELSYINNMIKGEVWQNTQTLGQLYPDISWRLAPRFLPAPITIGWNALFQLPSKLGVLSISSKLGKRKDNDEEVVVLELTARTDVVATKFADVAEWFSVAHEWIVNGFCDVTSAEVQKSVWRREDG